MIRNKFLTPLSATIFLILAVLTNFVLAVDLDEPNDNQDVITLEEASQDIFDNVESDEPYEAIDAITETDYTDSSEDESASLMRLLDADSTSGLAKDVVMVLDNSGSMKKNDPDFLATRAVSEFISSLDSQTRISIVIFDQNVSLAVPLTHLSEQARGNVLESLKKVNYKGLYTDSPAAIERAIYELKNNGRKDAQKSIVFMTDGIVDTGKADVDLEKSKWLKEDLAADAADESIRVFGVAFTEAADFQLIQSISQKTDGEYYRALEAADLQTVFEQINIILNKIPEADVVPEVEPVQVVQVAPPVQQPVIIEVPAQTPQAMGKEERLRSTIMIVAASVLFITLLAIVYILLRRGREMGSASVAVETDAFINDIHNYTASSQYQLSKKPTMFGRVAGKDTAHLNYLVIPESTIGRRHALIEYKDYGFWISDQGSINGTFVNDKMISSEVCLKHGDKVRLHKFEFEFTMPEMDDAGKTVMSGAHDASSGIADAATVVSNSHSEDAEIEVPDMEFDITGGADVDFELEMDEADGSENMGVEDDDEDETLIREDGKTDESESNAEAEPDFDSEDETLMPGGPEVRQAGAEESVDDETLMRGSFDGDDDEDMTIRKEGEESGDDFFDIGADDDTNNK